MKRILFIRHAESSSYDYSIADHDRLLTSKGVRDAENMGKRLLKNNIIPDLYITSSAKRAKNTCEIIKKELQNECNTITDKSIYYDGVKGVLDNIYNTNNNIKFIVIFGHNPTFKDIYKSINKNSCNKFPPCAAVLCGFSVNKWEDFSIEASNLLYYDYPNNIK